MIEDKELINLLNQVIVRNSYKLSQIAERLDVTPETISRWKARPFVGRKNRQKIAGLLSEEGVNLADIEKSSLPVKNPGDLSFDVPPPVLVPLLTAAQAASIQCNPLGSTSPNVEDGEMSGFMHAKPGDFAMVVSGHSMMPWYPPGTHLLVRPNEFPKTGNRVAVMLAGRTEPVFKIFIDLGSEFILMSINEEEGLPPIRLNKMDRAEYYWCWPIIESKRDENALDAAMRQFGIHHFWERRLEELKEKHAKDKI